MRFLTQIGEWFDRSACNSQRRFAKLPSIPCRRNTGKLVVRIWHAALTVFLPATGDGHSSRTHLRSIGRRGLEQSAGPQSRHILLLVHPRTARMGLEFMVAIVLIHMVQVFLFGAYKFPRELTWIVGVFLLLMTLGMPSADKSCGSIKTHIGDWELALRSRAASPSPVRNCEADARWTGLLPCHAFTILCAARNS